MPPLSSAGEQDLQHMPRSPYKSLQPFFLHLLFLCFFAVIRDYWDNVFTANSWLTGWLGEWACFLVWGFFNVWDLLFSWLIGSFVWFVLFSCGRCCSWCPHSLIICACLWPCPHCNWVCTQLMWAPLAIHWEGVTLTGQRTECHKLGEF